MDHIIKAIITLYRWQVGSGFTNCANMARWNLQEKLHRPETAKYNLPSKFLRSSTDLAETYQPVSKNIITNYSGHVLCSEITKIVPQIF